MSAITYEFEFELITFTLSDIPLISGYLSCF